MNKENIPVITDREKIYDKCENMEQLFDNYYLPLLDKHYSKTYELQRENQKYKEVIDKAVEEKENQQKEFMEWLEKKLLFYKINNQGFTMNVIEEILLKYKEITGQQDGQQSGQV